MANAIKPKSTSTTSKVPTSNDLLVGELGCNIADGVLFLKKSDNSIATFNTTSGTVTSVAISVPTGLSVTGTPITTSGTFAITLSSGYSIPTTTKQGQWDTAYSNYLQWDGGSTNLVAATARTSLGLVIGTNVQAWDADLDSIAALAGTSGLLKKTAANTWSLDTTAYGSGTVTSIATTSPITGGTITGTGTIGINASSANTASYVVQRDASGNFSAGTITATLTGTASTATNLAGGSGGTIPYQSAAGTTAMLSNGTAGQLLQANGGTSAPSWVSTVSGLTITGLKETKTAPAISTGTLTLNCSLGNVFAVSLNANITTLSFTNVPSTGTAFGLTLMLTADGTARTITWGSAVKWSGGTAPTLTSTNAKVDVFVLVTHDGGTTWYAFTSGQNL